MQFWYVILAQTSGGTTPPAPSQEQVDSGLIYVIAAYAVVWLLLFGYIFLMSRRQSQLKRDITLVKQELDELK
jgi:CcmD family protein